MSDIGNNETERRIAALEKKIAEEYKQAAREVQAKLDDYFRRFKIKDDAWQRMVESGEKTAAEYAAWREQQMMVGAKWEAMRNQLAENYHNANVIARNIITSDMADVYAMNFNWATYELEHGAGIDTSFTLVNTEAVERILRDNPDLLPPPGQSMLDAIAAGRDIAWQEGQIQSVMLQGILQGESIPNLSKRIAETMGEVNHKATIRYARTAMTGAQNAGREDAYHRAAELGCKMEREWQSVHDNRTRHEHRLLDQQVRAIDEPFEAEGKEIMYPGDPSCQYPEMIWNCRCRTRGRVKGLEPQARKYRSNTIEGQSYEEWKYARNSRSDPITKQEKIAEYMKWRTINELYKGK